jgi:hypothetical protein
MEEEQGKPTKRRRGCWYWGCSISVLVFLLMVFSCVAVNQYGHARLIPVVESYLNDVAAENYESAHARFTAEWQEQQPLEEFIRFHRAVRQRLGVFKSGSMTGVHLGLVSEMTTAQIVYSAQFENGLCDIGFALEKKNGEWVLVGAKYDSPLLENLYRCPRCGTGHDGPVNFCTGCGEPLDQYDPPEPAGSVVDA